MYKADEVIICVNISGGSSWIILFFDIFNIFIDKDGKMLKGYSVKCV